MSQVIRILSYTSAILGLVTILRPRNGLARASLWFPKLLAGAWTPFLAVAGLLAALTGLARRDWRAASAGLLGGSLALRHVRKVTAQHGQFEEAFGPEWQSCLRPELQARLRRHRYAPWRSEDPVRARCHRDVAYSTDPITGARLFADIWQPPPHVSPTGLGIVYVFGGGWHYMHRQLWIGRFLERLAGWGHCVMAFDYGLAPQASLADMVASVHEAVSWMVEQAQVYGVDPNRIVLMGSSSGAHLALLAAYAADHPAYARPSMSPDTSVKAVVSFSAFADLLRAQDYFQQKFGAYLTGRSAPERWFVAIGDRIFRRWGLLPAGGRNIPPAQLLPSLLGCTPAADPEPYIVGSPLAHVGPHCPPTLLFQGSHDFSGIAADGRRLHRALRREGVPAIYVEFPGTDHAFELMTMGASTWSPVLQAVLYDLERFLSLMAGTDDAL
jgi:acetyl esterase/lipase